MVFIMGLLVLVTQIEGGMVLEYVVINEKLDLWMVTLYILE